MTRILPEDATEVSAAEFVEEPELDELIREYLAHLEDIDEDPVISIT